MSNMQFIILIAAIILSFILAAWIVAERVSERISLAVKEIVRELKKPEFRVSSVWTDSGELPVGFTMVNTTPDEMRNAPLTRGYRTEGITGASRHNQLP